MSDTGRWPYAHRLYDQHGELLIETVHASTGSLSMEIAASAARISAGRPNRAGQIPSRLAVLGVDEATWHDWLANLGYPVPGNEGTTT